MDICVWDIETHDLTSTFGQLICVSVYDVMADDMYTFRQDDYVRRKLAKDMMDDRQLCVDVRDWLNEFDLHVTYFGKGFDVSHLNSRLALHGEKKMDSAWHLDPIWAFKGWRGLKFQSGKMKHVAEALGLEQKPEVSPETWQFAKVGRKEAMDEVVERCEADVRITWEIARYVSKNKLLKSLQMYP